MSQPERPEKRKNPYYPAFDLLLAKLLAAEEALHVAKAPFADEDVSSAEWATRGVESGLLGSSGVKPSFLGFRHRELQDATHDPSLPVPARQTGRSGLR